MKVFISLIMALFLWQSFAFAQNGPREFSEYEIKAAFLFKFIKFVEWPESSFSSDTEPIIIGVVGKDPFGRNLDDTISGKTVKNRPIVIKRFKRYENIGRCHVLFISSSEKKRFFLILKQLMRRPVLTVSDTRNFARNGGMINLFTRNRKIRFQINLTSVETSGLKISSRLLRLADIIKE